METLKVKIKQMTESVIEKEIKIPFFGFGDDFKYVKVLGPERIVTVSLNRTFCSVADVYTLRDVLSWKSLKEISEAEYDLALKEAYARLTIKSTP